MIYLLLSFYGAAKDTYLLYVHTNVYKARQLASNMNKFLDL